MISAETIKKQRREIRDLKEKLQHYKDLQLATDRWCDDVREKLYESLNRLQMICDGAYYTSETMSTDISVRLKSTASFGLKKIAIMKERRTWWNLSVEF